MNIQTDYSYNYNISMHGGPKKPNDKILDRIRKKIEQKLVDILPEKTFQEGGKRVDKYDRYGRMIARPDVNRGIMGASAVLVQPAIDYYNHRVDQETRTVSRNRTIAKIIACTSVGVLVRGTCYKLVNYMTNLKGAKKLSQALLPKDFIKELQVDSKKLANYKNALSTIIALGIMLITNFALDAPLTVYFTNKLNAKSAKKNKAKEVKNV